MTQKRFNSKLDLIKNNKNPEICLYHTSSIDRLPNILTKGLSPFSTKQCEQGIYELAEKEGIIDEDEIQDMVFECESPAVQARWDIDDRLGRKSSVYFVKNKDNILSYRPNDTTVEVPAELIPCKCSENDYNKENELYDLIYGLYSQYSSGVEEKEIWKMQDKVEATIRPLDNVINPYTTEVLCPCTIPANIIKPFGKKRIGSCQIN